jgi:hypothetical protein
MKRKTREDYVREAEERYLRAKSSLTKSGYKFDHYESRDMGTVNFGCEEIGLIEPYRNGYLIRIGRNPNVITSRFEQIEVYKKK